MEQTLGDGEGQAGLACCGLWGRKELDTAWRLNTHTHRSSFYKQATFSGGHVLSKYRPRSHELKPGERAFIPLSSSKLICNNLYGLYVTELST